ncbi:hypothetical protein CDD83_10222 [Cordyceps sp. RAO-2017]|nr:hypothetical protein CDD83_10222 [Cordyceps sp. RAO-2017]
MSLYHEAAEVLSASSSAGGSLKSRIFGRRDAKSPPGQLYALVLETRKWSAVLSEVVEGAELLRLERKLTPELSLLLAHDLLLSKGGIALPQSHGLRASVERHRGRLRSELTRARLRRGASSVEALREQVDRAAAGEEAAYPRWVRVNALKSSIEEQLETTFAGYARAGSVGEVVGGGDGPAGRRILIDPHVPGLVAVTPGTDLSKTDAYASGRIILQDKASCFPAYLLDPGAGDGDVVDACAAPGNKTTHLAAILHTHRPEFASEPQTIFAFERDAGRAQTLDKMVRAAGCKKMTRIGFGQDFLQVDPGADRYSKVGALLLDPSCSGSGIVGRDSLPPLHLPGAPPREPGRGAGEEGKKEEEKKSKRKRKRKLEEVGGRASADVVRDDDGNETVVASQKDLAARLEALAAFQLALLLHAFRFPAARKVTYSTCSVHWQENEGVVMAALRSDLAGRRGWRILQRDAQVRGMREWPVRGRAEACEGDAAVAEGCIRSYKDDGRGVMGFFVAGFVRDGADGQQEEEEEEEEEEEARAGDEGPYMRDGEGRIVRDALGMPVLRSTGEPVRLEAKEEDEAGASSGQSAAEEDEEDDDDDEDEDGDEWDGLGD